MTLPRGFLNQNAGRPQGLVDFDLPWGFHHLVARDRSPGNCVWTTSWGINLGFSCLFALLCGLFGMLFIHRSFVWTELLEPSIAQTVGLGCVGVFLLLAWLAAGWGMLYRGRLEIDGTRGELRFFREFRRKPSRVIPFASIRSLSSRKVETTSPDGEAGDCWHRVVIAELHDGRLASIAINPDWKSHSLFRDITVAIDRSAQASPVPMLLITG
jgi:hypothetical protein